MLTFYCYVEEYVDHSPGHVRILHCLNSFFCPIQRILCFLKQSSCVCWFPDLQTLRLLPQERLLDWVPSPHATVHSPQDFHKLHCLHSMDLVKTIVLVFATRLTIASSITMTFLFQFEQELDLITKESKYWYKVYFTSSNYYETNNPIYCNNVNLHFAYLHPSVLWVC